MDWFPFAKEVCTIWKIEQSDKIGNSLDGLLAYRKLLETLLADIAYAMAQYGTVGNPCYNAVIEAAYRPLREDIVREMAQLDKVIAASSDTLAKINAIDCTNLDLSANQILGLKQQLELTYYVIAHCNINDIVHKLYYRGAALKALYSRACYISGYIDPYTIDNLSDPVCVEHKNGLYELIRLMSLDYMNLKDDIISMSQRVTHTMNRVNHHGEGIRGRDWKCMESLTAILTNLTALLTDLLNDYHDAINDVIASLRSFPCTEAWETAHAAATAKYLALKNKIDAIRDKYNSLITQYNDLFGLFKKCARWFDPQALMETVQANAILVTPDQAININDQLENT